MRNNSTIINRMKPQRYKINYELRNTVRLRVEVLFSVAYSPQSLRYIGVIHIKSFGLEQKNIQSPL
jgi:hypothetical protein